MGKKDKKKGKGIEKTTARTEKKLAAKLKKQLAEIGEEDIEKLVADYEKEAQKRVHVKELPTTNPRRVNFSLVPHPFKDELIFFGGEFYNGQKTIAYNDFIFYNITKNEWTLVEAPNAPPPRCGHQMVALARDKGQLWMFGGEFTSSSENQFLHYKDLWVFHIANKKWEKISSPNGPSPRSGHRMVHNQKKLIIFGGYHDNLRDYKYFNDVYVFDLENYKWHKIEPTGTPPAPRSGCQMVPLPDGKILIQGGYSKEKIKKDVDKGTIHTDMFLLTPEKNDTTGIKWKWVAVKQGGAKMSPRSGCSIVLGPNNKAYSFGGVFDVEESEEDISGKFYSDLHCLDLEKRSWRQIVLTGKKDLTKKKRRKDKDMEGDADDTEEMDVPEEGPVVVSDGVFTMTIGPASQSTSKTPDGSGNGDSAAFSPSPRMNCGLAVKHGILYLYGGMVEESEKTITLADLYSIDLHKLDEWKTIIPDPEAVKQWVAPESESDDDDDDEDEDEEEDEDDEDEDDESEEEPMETD